jgi:hypothetical protein
MATAAALRRESGYWEQFFSALSCVSREECDGWLDSEVKRYVAQFGVDEETAWRTIACNLCFFAAYYDTPVVRQMRTKYQLFTEEFDSPEFRQEKRRSMNESGKAANDSPV